MTKSLANARIELSKQLNDFWSGTSTSAGVTGGTTIVDTALQAQANDWIDVETVAYDLITATGSSALNEEKAIQSLNSTGSTLTVLAHSVEISSSTTYEIHRLFSASEKRRALIYSARHIYPSCYDRLWDETMVAGNWLKDGSMEQWSTTSSLTYWSVSGSTLTQISSSPYYKHGTYSAKLSDASGNLSQSISNSDDLKRLAGRAVTFTTQAWCDTSSCLRLSVRDGINTEGYSSYHPGGSYWTDDNPRNDNLYVSYDIDNHATEVTFKINQANASGTSYIDDARIISSSVDSPRIYIGNLGLVQNTPVEVFVEPSNYYTGEPWTEIHGSVIDYEGGYLYLPSSVPHDRRLRIKGYKMLDFLDTSGASSTDWTATINLDQPQLDILIADAAVYLYETMSIPNFDSGVRAEFERAANTWRARLRERKAKYAMEPLPIPVRW